MSSSMSVVWCAVFATWLGGCSMPASRPPTASPPTVGFDTAAPAAGAWQTAPGVVLEPGQDTQTAPTSTDEHGHVALPMPVMVGPLAANPDPMSLDAGDWGPIYVTGAVSGLGML